MRPTLGERARAKGVVPVMGDYGDGRWGMHDGGSGWLMLLLMVVLVAAVVVAAMALLRGNASPAAAPAAPAVAVRPATDARAILLERFARGDIDESDYRARMRALDETGAPGA